jgi:hypothetical protein
MQSDIDPMRGPRNLEDEDPNYVDEDDLENDLTDGYTIEDIK